MESEQRPAPADPDQVEQLTELVRRARAQGVQTGIRDDEVQDLDEAGAAELIEQLRRRLGEISG